MNLSRLPAHARELLFLKEAEARARAVPEKNRDLVREHVSAAKRRLQILPGFGEPGVAVVTTTVLVDAIVILLRARALRNDATADQASLADLEPAEELERACESSTDAPREWRRVLPLLSSDDPLAMDRMGIEALRADGAVLERTTRWLAGHVDPRTPQHVVWQRRGRIAALVVVVLYAMLALYRALAHTR